MMVLGGYVLPQHDHHSRKMKKFTAYYWIIFSSILLDIASVVLVWNHSQVPTVAVYAVNEAYLAMGFIVPCLLTDYVFMLTGKQNRITWLWYLPVAVCIILVLLSPFNGWVMSVTPDNLYQRGVSTILLTINAAFYYVTAVVFMIRGNRFVTPVQQGTIHMAVVLTIVLGGIQAVYHQYLMMGFASSLITTMIYFSFQSADKNLDNLTGLLDRKGFLLATEKLMEQQPHTLFVMGIIDIQRFKLFNERFGSVEGNKMLAQVGKTVAKRVGGVGTYGRLESDHFAFCVPHEAFKTGQLSNEAVVYVRPSVKYHLRFRIGLYLIEDRELPVDVVCDRARMAMESIQSDYNKFWSYYDDSLREEIMTEQSFSDQMEEALTEKQFFILLQPIVDLKTGRTVMAEALVRWKHPEYGEISPGRFIPQFEKNGFIVELDSAVRLQALDLIARWQQEEKPVVPISVNFSRLDFENEKLLDNLIRSCQDKAVAPGMLKVEVTEGIYMDDPAKMQKIAKEFHSQGFDVFMDDFGSGYSSLNVLKKMPVDLLKIDLGFLREEEDSLQEERGAIILDAMIKMAQKLSIPTITEGIEKQHEAEKLCRSGSNYGQGYYFAKPMPVADFENRLAKEKESGAAPYSGMTADK